MSVSYEKLIRIMNEKGESFYSLYRKGIISNQASREIPRNKPVHLRYIDKLCRYFKVSIEDVVEIVDD